MLPDDFPYPDYLPQTPFARPVPGILVDPDAGELVSVSFNPAWLPYILGALQPLTLASTWKIDGDNTLELQQKRAMSLLHQFMQAAYSDRPFFQDAEEASNTSLPDYPWYEQASDWVIELFLAYTATPGAALAYKVFIPRLRLAFRTGNLGTIFKVLLDGLEVTTGDSYAPIEGLLEKVIDVKAFATEHSLGDGPYMMEIVNVGRASAARASVVETGGNLLEVVRGDIRDIGDTGMFRQDGSCGLQMSNDGGATWSTIFDAATCVSDGIQQAIDGGQVARPGAQPSPEPAPIPGGCKTYHVILNANDRWHCPSPVKNDDTVRVFNAKGGWCDGTLAWFCPNGARYLLGFCSGDESLHETGDPLNPGAFHMAVVGETLVDATWFDPMTLYTFAGLSANQDFILQANDGTLADDNGQIEFDVEICSAGWTHTFDFTLSDEGFSSWGYGGPYASGQGFQIQHNELAGGDVAQIYKPFTLVSGSKITFAQFFFSGDSTPPGGICIDIEAGTEPAWGSNIICDNPPQSSPHKMTPDFDGGGPYVLMAETVTNSGGGYFWQLVLRGTGSDPF